jgi:hypothetical protein
MPAAPMSSEARFLVRGLVSSRHAAPMSCEALFVVLGLVSSIGAKL